MGTSVFANLDYINGIKAELKEIYNMELIFSFILRSIYVFYNLICYYLSLANMEENSLCKSPTTLKDIQVQTSLVDKSQNLNSDNSKEEEDMLAFKTNKFFSESAVFLKNNFLSD